MSYHSQTSQLETHQPFQNLPLDHTVKKYKNKISQILSIILQNFDVYQKTTLFAVKDQLDRFINAKSTNNEYRFSIALSNIKDVTLFVRSCLKAYRIDFQSVL